MTIKFRKFVEFVSQQDEPTDEQINELFGIFKNNEKADKAKAAREKLKQDTAKKVADWRAKRTGQNPNDKNTDDDDDLYNQSIKAKNFQARTTTMVSPRAAAAGHAAERDWMGNLAAESKKFDPQHGTTYFDKAEWKEACKQRGAVDFEDSYPDLIAKNADGEDVGFWDGTDFTGTLDLKEGPKRK